MRAVDVRADVLHLLAARAPGAEVVEVVFADLHAVEAEAFGEQARRARRGGEEGDRHPRRVRRAAESGGEGHEVRLRADRVAAAEPDAPILLKATTPSMPGAVKKSKGGGMSVR